MLVASMLSPDFSTPGPIGYRVRLAKEEAPRYLPLIHVSSSWLTEPRSSDASAFAASAAVRVTVVRIQTWPMNPSGLVPFHSAHGPSAAGAIFHDASSYAASHGRPSCGLPFSHAASQYAPQRRIAAAGSVRYRSRRSRASFSDPSFRSVA